MKKMPFRITHLVTAAVAGTVLAVACQFAPFLRTINHQFTQFFSVVTAIFLYYLSARIAMRISESNDGLSQVNKMQSALLASLLAALATALSGFIVMALCNAFIHNCRFEKGVAFFWITWTPLAAFICVLGVVGGIRKWRWWRRTALLAVLILSSLLIDEIGMMSGVGRTDFFIGVPLCLDQRADMTVPHIHIYQRGMVLLISATLWYLALWRSGLRCAKDDENLRAFVRHTRNAGFVLAACVVLIILSAGSFVGIGWGRGALHATLSEELESEHFVFHYPPNGSVAVQIDSMVCRAEWYRHRLCSALNIDPKKRVDVYVMESSSMLHELTGMRSAHARPWQINLLRYSSDFTVHHELCHALDRRSARNDLDMYGKLSELKGDLGLIFDALLSLLTSSERIPRGRIEGLAQAYSKNYASIPEAHRRQAAALREGKLPSASVFMGPDGFRKVNESNAYNLAGSFMGFLALKYGPEKLKAFLDTDSDYELAFGKDVDGLDQEWRSFLEKVDTDIEEQMAMAESFDVRLNPAFKEECCPKLGSREQTLEEEALGNWYAGNHERALSIYEQLYATEDKTRFRFQQVQILRKLGRTDEALSILDELLADESAADAGRVRYVKTKASCLMSLQDWDELYPTLDDWAALIEELKDDTRAVHAALRNPLYRAEVARMLTTKDEYIKRNVLEKLIQGYPDDENIRYLYLTRALITVRPDWRGGVTPEKRAQVFELLKYIEAAPDTADQLKDNLSSFGRVAIFYGDFDFAEQIVRSLLSHCKDPVNRFEAEIMLEQIAFEREHHKEHVIERPR